MDIEIYMSICGSVCTCVYVSYEPRYSENLTLYV